MIDFLRRLLTSQSLYRPKKSYSQCGEDLIIDFILQRFVGGTPSYLDIGAHHPIHISNTYLFYQRGGRGVCIEPDPDLFSKFKNRRVRDTCLNVGVGSLEQESAEFYVMSSKSLSTFSRVEAERYEGYGTQKIENIIHIPLIEVNSIFESCFITTPDLVSIDVEGMDLEILSAIDFSRFRPTVFCVETLTYTEDRTEKKCDKTISYMEANGYFPYADTYVNTIFVDREKWQSCK